MRFVFLIFLSLVMSNDIFSQSRQADREPYAAGRFYSANAEALRNDLKELFAGASKTALPGQVVRAVIVPHAGYVFSGKTAASAYLTIPPDRKFRNIFLIGSSHVMAFDGASLYYRGDFTTPLGKMKVNTALAETLRKENQVLRFPDNAHIQEHSLEVQVPFIQYYFKEPQQIVPLIIGTNNKNTIKTIADALKPYFTDENLFIISSDFSHYPPYKEATEVDNITANAILSKDPEKFLRTIASNSSKGIENLATSMCGWTSGLMLLYLVNNNPSLEFRKIYYCNSGDSRYGDKDEVVGYHSIVLTEKANPNAVMKENNSETVFTSEEKKQLFSIARNSISLMLNEKRRQVLNPAEILPGLKKNMGAFVTLRLNGKLRGCIGRFVSDDPLYEVVNQMAIASAFDDTRFMPLTKEEFKSVEIEISVIGPLKRIHDINEIVLGKHGIYIKKDFRSGTMLPQVAAENKWSVEEFLGYTSREKAGLGWDGWKNAELFVYETVVLEEK